MASETKGANSPRIFDITFENNGYGKTKRYFPYNWKQFLIDNIFFATVRENKGM